MSASLFTVNIFFLSLIAIWLIYQVIKDKRNGF